MEELESLPARLLTVQVYSPPSDAETLLMVSVDSRDVDVMLASVRTEPLNVHSNVLLGPPIVWQVKMCVSSKLFVGLIGFSRTEPSGDTAKMKQQIEFFSFKLKPNAEFSTVVNYFMSVHKTWTHPSPPPPHKVHITGMEQYHHIKQLALHIIYALHCICLLVIAYCTE